MPLSIFACTSSKLFTWPLCKDSPQVISKAAVASIHSSSMDGYPSSCTLASAEANERFSAIAILIAGNAKSAQGFRLDAATNRRSLANPKTKHKDVVLMSQQILI
jgi:hypothetical protein